MQPSRHDLIVAGRQSGTDKILRHGYDRFYVEPFARIKNGESIVEIGYGSGQSIPFWRSLFPSSHLYVLDRDVQEEGEGFNVDKCDQSSLIDLKRACSRLAEKRVGLILDDGSHLPEHQLLTFNHLFCKVLKPGGAYIIEDIEVSYWKYSNCYGYKTRYGADSPRSIVNIFASVPSWINRQFLCQRDKRKIKNALIKSGLSLRAVNQVSSVSFCHNCIVINKRCKRDARYSSAPYPFAEMIRPTFRKNILLMLEKVFPSICV